ncbi:MAG: hypothetical protein C0517_06670 [Erythrobacter sp.]|nr:hypothetical protein [Erythrobacter sp.]
MISADIWFPPARFTRPGDRNIVTVKKTPHQIWDQHEAGLPLDTGHEISDGKGEDSDFIHADGDSWERKVGERDWKRVPHIRERP